MYVGRLLIVGPTVGAYRVSSRSFPHRKILKRDGMLTVQPTDDAPATDNPYVTYNCVRTTEDAAVLGNGSHVDPIAEKLALGYPPRDALAECLLALDYEKDDYDTPRIAGVLSPGRRETAHVGIVRRDALIVQAADRPTIVATYEKDTPEPIGFHAAAADVAARAAYDLDFEHPVCAAGVVPTDTGFDLAIANDPAD